MAAPDAHPILIYAPLARDAEAIGAMLRDFDTPLHVCRDRDEFREALFLKPLCAIVTQEAADPATADILEEDLAGAPSWSTLPLIFIVSDATRLPPACRALIERDPPADAIIVQRPARPAILHSVVRTQTRLRQRQFETARLMQALEEANDRSKFLLSELRHRVGNMLSVTESTVRLTARNYDDVKAFRDAIAARIGAMAAANRLLTDTDQENTPVEQILRRHVEPYCRSEDQFSLDGPEIELDGKTAFSFALIVHEMATNAAKYGALSSNEGLLRVEWQAAEKGFSLRWKETLTENITPPTEQSFGSMAIGQMTRQLGADGRIDFEPDGLLWRFSLPDATGSEDAFPR